MENHEDCDVSILDNRNHANGVKAVGKEWGYDPHDFLREVRSQLQMLCHTGVSDI